MTITSVKKVKEHITNRIKELRKMEGAAKRRKNKKVRENLLNVYVIRRLELKRLLEDIG